MYGLDSWLDRDTLTGAPQGWVTVQQPGSGVYSLCERCNESAGSDYVPEFLDWASAGREVIDKLPLGGCDAALQETHVDLRLEGRKPARFLKQVVTMLLALAPYEFSRLHPALSEYARDRDAVALDERYQFYLAMFACPLARFVGGAVILRWSEGAWQNDFVIELAYPPVSYVLSVDESSPPASTACISGFSDLRVDQTADVELPALVGFGHTLLPLDFRSRAMLDNERPQSLAN